MVLEFCGLPGVGKSTIARALESHGFVRVRIQSTFELCTYNVLYLLRFPHAFFKMLFIIIRVSFKHGRFYRLFMNVFLDTNARILKAKKGDRYMIVDQGHLQALLSVSYHQISKAEIENFLSNLPMPDRVYIFEASETVRSAHLKERGYTPRQNEEDAEEWFRYLDHNMTLMSCFVREGGRYDARVISTEKPVNEIVEEIRLSV